MNIFTITLAFLSIAHIPTAEQPQQSIPDFTSCKELAHVLKKATNDTCLLFENQPHCIQQLELFAPSISSEIAQKISNLDTACKKEIMYAEPVKMIARLNNGRKKINCDRENLDDTETFFCQQSKKDIEQMNRILGNQQ